ncbi:MAG: prepilin-type N-terminal cleavage/methylation domain-containing protein, partial [Thermodesulfobacteriota bacterium]
MKNKGFSLIEMTVVLILI